MESHLSQLQDIVRLTIRDELSRLEPRFQRITMSEDAAGKPAELYGADGKIYYRKAGGAGGELGTGDEGDARYVRKDAGAGTQTMRNDLHFINYQVLEFFDNAPTLRGDISVDVSDNFVIESKNSGILTLVSAAGHIACSGDRLSDVGTPVASGDAVKVDAAIHVPLAQLPLTSKGTVLAGGGSAAGVLAIDTDGYVLTLDAASALGVKWAASGVGAYLPLSAGSGKPLTGDLYLDNGTTASPLLYLEASTDGIYSYANNVYFYIKKISDNALLARCTLSSKDWALQGILRMSGGDINMYNHDVIDVGGITMNDATSPIAMTGSKITGVQEIMANADTGGIVLQGNVGGSPQDHAYMCRKVGAEYLHDFFVPLDMNGQEIRGVGVLKGHSTNNLSFWDNATGTKTLAQLAAADGTKILNAAGTAIVECKTAGDIDITVPSGKVVTFIRS